MSRCYGKSHGCVYDFPTSSVGRLPDSVEEGDQPERPFHLPTGTLLAREIAPDFACLS